MFHVKVITLLTYVFGSVPRKAFDLFGNVRIRMRNEKTPFIAPKNKLSCPSNTLGLVYVIRRTSHIVKRS